jgi:hypothetical protein
MKILFIVEDNDQSKNRIILWALHNIVNAEIVVLNENVEIIDYSISIGDNTTVCIHYYEDGQTKIVSKVDRVLFRRWMINSAPQIMKHTTIVNSHFTKHLHGYYRAEIDCVNFTINNYFSSNFKRVGNPFVLYVDKLKLSDYARKCGLLVPETYIISKRDDLLDLFESGKKYITKGISDTYKYYSDATYDLSAQTSIVHKEDILKAADETFFPSFIQEFIPKYIDLRIFYLKKKFYSMAIFSQLDEQTKTDFRNYNHSKMNRMVPFNLPSLIQKKLTRLLNMFELDTCSVDFCIGLDEKYYLLDINPVGQYGFVSHNCNYYLDREFANELI